MILFLFFFALSLQAAIFHGNKIDLKKISLGVKKKQLEKYLGKGLNFNSNVLYYFYSKEEKGMIYNKKTEEILYRFEFENDELIKKEEIIL